MDGLYPASNAAVGKAPHFDGQCRPSDRDMLLKQSQSNQVTSAPHPPPPTTIRLVTMVVEAARGVYRESLDLLGATVGEVPESEANRDGLDGLKGELALAIRLIHEACGNLSNLRKITGVFLLCLFLGGVAFAQKPAAPAPAADDNIACINKVQPTTGFTECEMLRLSNYISQINSIQTQADAQKGPVATDANEFIGKVVAVDRNKGKQYESPSKQFPLGRLVPIPPPPAAPAATPAPPIGPHTGPLPTPESTPAAPAPAPAKK